MYVHQWISVVNPIFSCFPGSWRSVPTSRRCTFLSIGHGCPRPSECWSSCAAAYNCALHSGCFSTPSLSVATFKLQLSRPFLSCSGRRIRRESSVSGRGRCWLGANKRRYSSDMRRVSTMMPTESCRCWRSSWPRSKGNCTARDTLQVEWHHYAGLQTGLTRLRDHGGRPPAAGPTPVR